MSSPFYFTPAPPTQQDLQPSPYLYQFRNQSRVSPHIPTVSLDPSAPNTPSRQVRFLDDDPWAAPPPRSRRPSWHAGMATPNLGVPGTPGFGFSSTNFQTFGLPEDRSRRRSFDSRSYQRPVIPEYHQGNLWTPGTPYPIQTQIHPLLSGPSSEPRSQPIFFDLSSSSFNPLRVIGAGRVEPISTQELAEPATHPPTTRLNITCDKTPRWPILLDYNLAAAAANGGYLSGSPSTVPITLGDVLYAIYTSMQTQISHIEWARLSNTEETAISRAYTRRCRAIPSMEELLASQGVRRVDYLLKKCMVAGLVRAQGDDGYDNLKLVVTSRTL